MTNKVQLVLGTIGKHASKVLPLSIVIGLCIPQLAEIAQPLLAPALLVSLTISLVRIETEALFKSLFRWQWVVLLCGWILVLSPVIVWLVLQLFSLPESITKAALITAAAPPVTACAAIAIFLNIDAAIAVVITIVTMLLVPLSLPPIVYYLAGLQIEIGLWQVSLRLAAFIFAAFILASLIKKLVGSSRIHRQRSVFDGISVIFIGIFIIGVMHGVTEMFFRQPLYMSKVLAVSTCLVLGLNILGTALFWRFGPRTALAIGLASGNCNMGLVYLILMDQAPLDLLVFFAVGQVPMYFIPSLLAPAIRRILAR
jgi:BASS family bile acid:Na+ symporter